MAGEGGATVDLNLEIKRELASMAEPEFRKFEVSLLPGVENIIGVRLPSLRKLAKKLSKDEWRSYLECASDDTFEEIMLQGMVIGLVKTDVDEVLRYAAEFCAKDRQLVGMRYFLYRAQGGQTSPGQSIGVCPSLSER